jgi:PTH2 family peptidyl-tRNA hydrolase
MKQVIVIRKDLRTSGGQKVRGGKIAAQVAHASHLTAHYFHDDPRYREWTDGKFRKIVVGAESEEHLRELQQRAERAGILTVPITDSGLTEFGGVPTLTCIGFGPDTDENLDSITGDLPLQ